MPWAYIRTKDKFDGPIFRSAYIREEKYFKVNEPPHKRCGVTPHFPKTKN